MSVSPRRLGVSLVLASLACSRGPSDNPFATGNESSASSTESSESSTTASTAATTTETEAGSETDDGGVKLDVLPDGDLGGPCQDGPCGEVEFSYIWVSNAPQGTVSKIDTQTLAETGRYWTRPDLGGNPSRTSVNVSGRAVAVANRWGGVIKIWASESDCEDTNGTPGIQTSTGKFDVLPWGEDECVAWYTPMPYTTQRPIAWSAGELDPRTCEFVDEKVWIAGGSGVSNGGCDGGPWMVHRLDGETGAVVDDVAIDAVVCTSTGPYGAAVDVTGALWIDSRTDPLLVRVDGESLDYSIHPIPIEIPPGSYGITADNQGDIWITNTSQSGPLGGRYDPELDEWAWVDWDAQSIGGVTQAPDGNIWMARWGTPMIPGDEIVVVDRDTLEILTQIPSPDGNVVKGLSADAHGFMWTVTESSAHKIDPETLEVQSYNGLDMPYTYSDMTGAALVGTACGPVG